MINVDLPRLVMQLGLGYDALGNLGTADVTWQLHGRDEVGKASVESKQCVTRHELAKTHDMIQVIGVVIGYHVSSSGIDIELIPSEVRVDVWDSDASSLCY